MKYTSTQHINTLLHNSSIITDFCNKLQQLKQLNQIVSSLLPTTIANNCSVANLRDGILILTTNSPVWKHQINFLKIDLLEKLRNTSPMWAGIISISVRIDYLAEDLNTYQNNIKLSNLNIITNNTSNDKINHKIKVNKNFTISPQTALLVNSIVDQEISYKPLSCKLKNLIEKLCQ